MSRGEKRFFSLSNSLAANDKKTYTNLDRIFKRWKSPIMVQAALSSDISALLSSWWWCWENPRANKENLMSDTPGIECHLKSKTGTNVMSQSLC